MMFDWMTAKLYLKDGRRIRLENWDYGEYLWLCRGKIVDHKGLEIDQEILNKYRTLLYWNEYLEIFHGKR